MEQLIYGERRDESERFPQLPEEAAGPEDAEQAEEQESASADGNALAQGENFSPREESGMDDLKSIGAFVPAEGVLGTVVVQTRPGQTYYKAAGSVSSIPAEAGNREISPILDGSRISREKNWNST